MNTTTPSQEKTATLKARVCRAPRSLAPYHYYLESGSTVYVVTFGIPDCRVSSVPEGERRISEDYFSVPTRNLNF